ncbi:hypothetical protein MAP00_008257 [Monascus purpureus]|nr:hypothetical protein MAP00_008257 [Monascus purpureus]
MDQNFGPSRSDNPTGVGLEEKGSVHRAREMLTAGSHHDLGTPGPNTAPLPLFHSAHSMAVPRQSHDVAQASRCSPPMRQPRPGEPVSPRQNISSSALPYPPSYRFEQKPGRVTEGPNLKPPSSTSVPPQMRDRARSGGSAPPFPTPRKDQNQMVKSASQNSGPGSQTYGRRPPPVPPTISEESFSQHSPLESPSRQVVPSSWYSSQTDIDIIGAYMDSELDDKHGSKIAQAIPVRQASPRKIDGAGKGVASDSQAGEDGSYKPEGRPSSDAFNLDPEKYPFGQSSQPVIKDTANNNSSHVKEARTLSKAAPTMSDRRPFGRRPPRLDMDAVQEAQARGSLTSLKDLIERATRLASNLERGRTASRINLSSGHMRNESSSISGILAAFPPPAMHTSERPGSTFSHFLPRSNLRRVESLHSEPDAQGAPKRQRRCCGMSPWMFMLVCVLALVAILVAVLVPIFVVVVPRQQDSGNSVCEKSLPCHNGGVSVSSGSICSCVCNNGYTGNQCTTPGDTSCVTTQLSQDSQSNNVTLGSALPRLLEDSQANFSIPLDHTTILALFSQANVSCTTENALVSFAGVSSNSKRELKLKSTIVSLDAQSHPGTPPSSTSSGLPTQTIAARGSASTMDGIVFDDSSQTTGTTATATTTTTSASMTTTQSASMAQPTSTHSALSPLKLDFSRISVLFILEKTGLLAAAMDSEQRIQSYLTGDSTSGTTGNNTLEVSNYNFKGSGFTLDFENFSITMPNGTVVGGK